MNLEINFTDLYRGIYNKPVFIKQSTFPAGERYLKIQDESILDLSADLGQKYCAMHVTVTPLSANSDTVVDLILLNDAIKQIDPRITTFLNFDYLPYGRQDRVCAPGESNSLKLFMDILCKAYDSVSIMDTHNAKFPYPENVVLLKPDYLKDFRPIFNSEMSLSNFNKERTAIVQVDAGARDRCVKAAEVLRIDNIIVFSKQRTDGRITHKCESDSLMFNPKKIDTFIVIDDICDGGGTFLSVASELQKINPSAYMVLVVTHGIFSAGFDRLREYYKEIFVHNNSFNLGHL